MGSEKNRCKELVIYFFYSNKNRVLRYALKQKAGFQLLPSVLFLAHDKVYEIAKIKLLFSAFTVVRVAMFYCCTAHKLNLL